MESLLVITAEAGNLALLRRFIKEKAAQLQADQHAIDDLVQAVDESATNIIVHGYRGQPGSIEITIASAGDAVVVRLRDQAPLFDPTRLPPPDLTRPIEERISGGLGVFLTMKLMDQVSYRVTVDGSNELTLRKIMQG
jgi:serine/threonine-protein kinase RsbW